MNRGAPTDPFDFSSSKCDYVNALMVVFPQSPLRLRLLYDSTSKTTTSSSATSYYVQVWVTDLSGRNSDVSFRDQSTGLELWCVSTLPKEWLRTCRDLAFISQQDSAPPSLLLEFRKPIRHNSTVNRGRRGTTYKQKVEQPMVTLAGRRAFLWMEPRRSEHAMAASTTHRNKVYEDDMWARVVKHSTVAGMGTRTPSRPKEEELYADQVTLEHDAVIQYILETVEFSKWRIHDFLHPKVTLQDFSAALECSRQSLPTEEFRRYERLRLAYSRRDVSGHQYVEETCAKA